MILGQTAGTAAALVAKSGTAVHDVDRAGLAGALLRANQILSSAQFPGGGPSPPPGGGRFVCGLERCLQPDHHEANPSYPNSSCGGECGPLRAREWLALKSAFRLDAARTTLTTIADTSFLKKSELISGSLPGLEKMKVTQGEVLKLSAKAVQMDTRYWLVVLA